MLTVALFLYALFSITMDNGPWTNAAEGQMSASVLMVALFPYALCSMTMTMELPKWQCG